MLDRPHPVLADLKSRRSALAERTAVLTEQRARLRQAEDAESAALQAIGALGREEVAAVSAWASEGAAGTAPSLDHAKREELTRDLVEASAAAEAARGAAGALDAEMADVGRESASLAGKIEGAAVDVLITEFRARWAGVEASATALRAEVASVVSLTSFGRDMAEELGRRNREDASIALLRKLEPLYGSLTIDIRPNVAEVVAAVPEWAERFRDLVR